MSKGFHGLYHGSNFYRCRFVANSDGTLVKTGSFDSTVAAMTSLLGLQGKEPLDVQASDDELVTLIKGGKLTNEGARYLLPHLSQAEANLLQLFGIDLGKLASGTLTVEMIQELSRVSREEKP